MYFSTNFEGKLNSKLFELKTYSHHILNLFLKSELLQKLDKINIDDFDKDKLLKLNKNQIILIIAKYYNTTFDLLQSFTVKELKYISGKLDLDRNMNKNDLINNILDYLTEEEIIEIDSLITNILKFIPFSKILYVIRKNKLTLPKIKSEAISTIVNYTEGDILASLNLFNTNHLQALCRDMGCQSSNTKKNVIDNLLDFYTEYEEIEEKSIVHSVLRNIQYSHMLHILKRNNLEIAQSKSEAIDIIDEYCENDIEKCLYLFNKEHIQQLCKNTTWKEEDENGSTIIYYISPSRNKPELIDHIIEHYTESDDYEVLIEGLNELNELLTDELEQEKIPEKTNKELFEDTTKELVDSIISDLERGVRPWKEKWTKYGLPANFISKREYRMSNAIYLIKYAEKYECPYFATAKQIEKLGGELLEVAEPIAVGYKGKVKKKIDKPTEKIFEETPEKEEIEYSFYKVHILYNIMQTRGLEDKIKKHIIKENEPGIIDMICENIYNKMPDKPKIKHEIYLESPSYSPGSDIIKMPKIELFEVNENYYSTLYHELAHSTGHHSRLNREKNFQSEIWGDENYAKEELIAELASSILCAKARIINQTWNDHTPYLNNWLNSLKENPQYLWKMIYHAQKAADYIQGEINN